MRGKIVDMLNRESIGCYIRKTPGVNRLIVELNHERAQKTAEFIVEYYFTKTRLAIGSIIARLTAIARSKYDY